MTTELESLASIAKSLELFVTMMRGLVGGSLALFMIMIIVITFKKDKGQ